MTQSLDESKSPLSSGRERQQEVYIGGVAGRRPNTSANFKHLEQQAKTKLKEEAYAYIAGGAGLEDTMSENRRAFQRWRIVPRMLRDVSQRNTETELFGQTLPFPMLLAPIGVLDMAHEEADRAVAKAAASEGIPFIFSSQASVSMESCAEVMGDQPRWFQLYWSKSDALVKSLVQRAEQAGCEAIVVTLDTTLLGYRARDLDLAYLPFLRARGIAQYVSDPVFLDEMVQAKDQADPAEDSRTINLSSLNVLRQMLKHYPGSPLRNLREQKPMTAVQHFINTYSRPSLTWEDLPFIRSLTDLPILLKGILHPDDARQAKEYDIDGVIVSNHGGRQVDGAIATLDALPEIRKAVGDDFTVLMDSGIRGGSDIIKALALGADAVCLGRPYVYGLAMNGAPGVREVIRNIKADFDLTMGLSGLQRLDQINSSILRRLDK
jgi:lactate 2-monooxygenase